MKTIKNNSSQINKYFQCKHFSIVFLFEWNLANCFWIWLEKFKGQEQSRQFFRRRVKLNFWSSKPEPPQWVRHGHKWREQHGMKKPSQGNRENAETDGHSWALDYEKGSIIEQWQKRISLINNIGTIKYPYVNKKTWPLSYTIKRY